jgi:hypothetical protein
MPVRPLTYHAVHRMFERVNDRAGTTATLHSLRHTAAYRMAEDPKLTLTDVQLVLGHSQLTTTQIYFTNLFDALPGGSSLPGTGPSRRTAPAGHRTQQTYPSAGIPARVAASLFGGQLK